MAQIKTDYNSGKLLTGEVGIPKKKFVIGRTDPLQLKAMCIKRLQDYVATFQERRSQVTDTVVSEFMSVRSLEWQGNPKVPRADRVVPVVTDAGGETTEGDGKISKSQQKKALKEQQVAAKKAEKEAAKAKEKAEKEAAAA